MLSTDHLSYPRLPKYAGNFAKSVMSITLNKSLA